jgi:hypothetical protein
MLFGRRARFEFLADIILGKKGEESYLILVAVIWT